MSDTTAMSVTVINEKMYPDPSGHDILVSRKEWVILRERIEELEKELNAAKWWADKRDICWDDLIGGGDE